MKQSLVHKSESDKAQDNVTMIEVKNVSMCFNSASEQLNSLKEYFIKLSKRELFFKEFKALDDISFTVNKGDVYGIVGTNGSGKSTMLKIVAGVLTPSEGSCTINGTIAPLIELGAGFDLELTASENIYLNGALLGYTKKYIDEHFDEIVDFAELSDFMGLPLKNYSSGMVARIAFAVATVMIPDILIVDEALSVGDVFFQEKCERRINYLIEEHNTTVLFVSHSMDQVQRVCDKAIWIEKGILLMNGPVQEVCQAYHSVHSVNYALEHELITPAIEITDLSTILKASVAKETFHRCTLTEYKRKLSEEVTIYEAGRIIFEIARLKRPNLVSDATYKQWCKENDIYPVISVKEDAPKVVNTSQNTVTVNQFAGMLSALYNKILVFPSDILPLSVYSLQGDYDFCVDNALLGGYGATPFDPEGNLSQAQVITLLWRIAGRPTVKACSFPKYQSDYFFDAVNWAAHNNVIDNAQASFNPDTPITPSEFAFYIKRAIAAMKDSDTRQRGEVSKIKSHDGALEKYIREQIITNEILNKDFVSRIDAAHCARKLALFV